MSLEHLRLAPLALALAAVGCAHKPTTQSDVPTSHAASVAHMGGPKLDESRLPPVGRLSKADLDESHVACKDFAGYVNRKWLAKNDVPGDRTSWGPFEMLDERSKAVQHQLVIQAGVDLEAEGVKKIVGDLWATGMDETKVEQQGLDPLRDDLVTIAGLSDAHSIEHYLHALAKRGEGFLFSFGPEADFADSSMNMAYVAQGGLGLPDKPYYFDADKAEKLAAYETHIAAMLKLSGVDAASAAKQAKDVIAFETRLAKASRSREELSRDVSLWYNPVSPAEADKLTPHFRWTRFFRSQGLQAPKRFSLAMPDFHAEVSKMLVELPVAQWQSYLRFHVVDGAAPYLSKAIVEENYNFHRKALRGQTEMRPRWKRVLATVNGEAGEALGQMYVTVAFPPESKTRMKRLVKNLGGALKERLEGLGWMGDGTKERAMEKWASFMPKIGYTDKWRSWEGLETSRSSYLANVRAAKAFNHAYELAKIGKPVDKTEWGMSPQTVNAYYNPLQNEIVFPAAILQPPFFDPEADDALNYGGIGAVIGHEMIHGYDDQGSRFGPSGNFEKWWAEDDAKKFGVKTEALVKQFDGYEAIPGTQVNGKLTLGENIADLGGLAVAYDAMRAAVRGQEDPVVDGFTRDQRFFMNWATVWRRKFTEDELKVRLATDPHAPANFRAIGAPSNLPAFQKAFGCSDADPMVRTGKDRIILW